MTLRTRNRIADRGTLRQAAAVFVVCVAAAATLTAARHVRVAIWHAPEIRSAFALFRGESAARAIFVRNARIWDARAETRIPMATLNTQDVVDAASDTTAARGIPVFALRTGGWILYWTNRSVSSHRAIAQFL